MRVYVDEAQDVAFAPADCSSGCGFDDRGTGTEEWGGGGDYWGGRNMTLPFAGHPVGTRKKDAKDEKGLLNSAYRFLVAGIFPFGDRAVISLEHEGTKTSMEHYSGVV